MRRPVIAGNWKMNKTAAEAVAFVNELAPRLASYVSVDSIVCPPFIAIESVAGALRGTTVKVGAQNVSAHEKGAYTSQISAGMLAGLAEFVIIGHSECREYLGETDAVVNAKIKAALAAGLTPIFACGENLAVYEAGETNAFVSAQVRAGLDNIPAEAVSRMIIAYEPIWAIGTGKAATAEIAENICGGAVRATVAELYGQTVAEAVRVQYGGSVKPSNMREYMSCPNVDGALVGGASLIVDDFTALVAAAAEAKG
jgi:triosephosphate isomerase